MESIVMVIGASALFAFWMGWFYKDQVFRYGRGLELYPLLPIIGFFAPCFYLVTLPGIYELYWVPLLLLALGAGIFYRWARYPRPKDIRRLAVCCGDLALRDKRPNEGARDIRGLFEDFLEGYTAKSMEEDDDIPIDLHAVTTFLRQKPFGLSREEAEELVYECAFRKGPMKEPTPCTS